MTYVSSTTIMILCAEFWLSEYTRHIILEYPKFKKISVGSMPLSCVCVCLHTHTHTHTHINRVTACLTNLLGTATPLPD